MGIAKFRCQICGGEFDPDPRMICDGGWDIVIPEGALTEGSDLTPDDVAEMDDAELVTVGIEPEDRAKILRGESVTTTFCICLECQDRESIEVNQ